MGSATGLLYYGLIVVRANTFRTNSTICAAPLWSWVLVRIVDRHAAAHAVRARPEERRHEIGELIPRQATGFVRDVGQALGGELDGVQHVEIDVQPPPVDVTREFAMARRPAPAGSSATSASGATHTPLSASVPTLKRCPPGVVARVRARRGARVAAQAGGRRVRRSADVRSVPSSSPISVLAASPSSETSSGMVSSCPSMNTRPTSPT